MRGPLAALDTWTAVMDAAGHRCHCTGVCGSKHTKSAGQCDRDTDREHLVAAPDDLTLSDPETAAVPTAELRAWCSGCYRGAESRQYRERRAAAFALPPDENPYYAAPLFDL